MVTPTLPPELIVDILPKLPVKSLMRFRSVSKSFQELISDRRFVKMHLKTQRERHLFFFPSSLHIAELKETSSGGHALQVVELDCEPIKPRLSRVRFLGSCHGMLCVIPSPITSYSSHDVYVYNPSTRESKQLPYYQPETHSMILFGFGYAPACDDYKFVKIFWKKRVMHVFSLKNNYWKTVEIDLDANLSPELRLPSYFNGALHWAFRNNVIGSRMIAALDLVEEKFNYLTLPQPRVHRTRHVYLIFLEVIGDYLGIIGHSYNGNIEVWLMKEYGVKESWAKFSTDRRFYWLSSLGNNKLLLSSNERELLLWDLKEGTRKNLNDGTCNDVKTRLQDLTRLKGWYKPIVIVESIVSPNYNYADFTINGGLF